MLCHPPAPKILEACRELNGKDVPLEQLNVIFSPYPGYVSFALFNYNNYGPVVVVADEAGTRVFRGYDRWSFANFHYMYFLGYGVKTIDERTSCPVMFKTGTSDMSDVVVSALSCLAGEYLLRGMVIRRVQSLMHKLTRGWVFTLRGFCSYTPRDFLIGILTLIRKRVGVGAFERLQELFLERGVYYQPSPVCRELQCTLNQLREFLNLVHTDHARETPREFFLSLGFQ